MFTVYILYSKKLGKFYVGYTSDIEIRLEQHNNAISKFSKGGIPWQLIYSIKIEDKKEAILLERKIKKNGAKRYLERNSLSYKINE